MNFLRKIERNLTALALVPLVDLEAKERKRILHERLMRLEQKRKESPLKSKIV
jgi:hypothetical protein